MSASAAAAEAAAAETAAAAADDEPDKSWALLLPLALLLLAFKVSAVTRAARTSKQKVASEPAELYNDDERLGE